MARDHPDFDPVDTVVAQRQGPQRLSPYRTTAARGLGVIESQHGVTDNYVFGAERHVNGCLTTDRSRGIPMRG